MKMSAKDFLTCNKKQITLLGMSGAGKTTLANKLSPKQWFHYSAYFKFYGKNRGSGTGRPFLRNTFMITSTLLMMPAAVFANSIILKFLTF